jgi:hypothetical protein
VSVNYIAVMQRVRRTPPDEVRFGCAGRSVSTCSVAVSELPFDATLSASYPDACRVSSSVKAGKASVSNAAFKDLLRGGLYCSDGDARLRCVSSFQPAEPKEPLLMSDSDGAFEAVVPVAAHMPGGGFTSMSLPVAVRSLFETVEALVDVRSRVFVEGESQRPSGCGNGTGVAVSLLGDAIFIGMLSQERLRLICEGAKGGRSLGELAMGAVPWRDPGFSWITT